MQERERRGPRSAEVQFSGGVFRPGVLTRQADIAGAMTATDTALGRRLATLSIGGVRVCLARVAFSRLLPWESLAANARPIPALDAKVDGLAPPHALLMACVHRVAHHFNPPTLIWLYDVHLLGSSMSDDDATRFVALAVDGGLTAMSAREAWRCHAITSERRCPRRSITSAGRRQPLATYMDQAFGPSTRSSRTPGAGRHGARWQLLREHLFLPSRTLRRGPSTPGLGSAALGVRAPNRSGRRSTG